MHIRTYMQHICTHTCTYTHIHSITYIHTHTYTYTYIHTYIHTHTYTCIVFLGGSCNPTVWRKEIAIPLLQEDGITYFNPVSSFKYCSLMCNCVCLSN